MTGTAYAVSAEMAEQLGAFAGFGANREAMLRVIRNHRRAACGEKRDYEGLSVRPVALEPSACPVRELVDAARAAWDTALERGERARLPQRPDHGDRADRHDRPGDGLRHHRHRARLRAGQVQEARRRRLLQDHQPHGAEGARDARLRQRADRRHRALRGRPRHADRRARDQPRDLRAKGFTPEVLERLERALPAAFDIKFAFNHYTLGETFCRETLGISDAQLADLGFDLLEALGFSRAQYEAANLFCCGAMTVEGAPHLQDAPSRGLRLRQPCGRRGTRYLATSSHIRMMAAAQPFITGAISKTINMPATATVEDCGKAYLQAWQLGLKAMALYRDGSKLSQPLLEPARRGGGRRGRGAWRGHRRARRSRPPRAWSSAWSPRAGACPTGARATPRRPWSAATRSICAPASTGRPVGEIFIDMHKEGAAFRSLMNSFAIAVSIGLQYGVPLEEFVEAFAFTRFEPSGPVQGNDTSRWRARCSTTSSASSRSRISTAPTSPTSTRTSSTATASATARRERSPRDDALAQIASAGYVRGNLRLLHGGTESKAPRAQRGGGGASRRRRERHGGHGPCGQRPRGGAFDDQIG